MPNRKRFGIICKVDEIGSNAAIVEKTKLKICCN